MQTRGIRIIDDQDFASIDSDILLPSTSMVLQWFSCNKVTYRYILLYILHIFSFNVQKVSLHIDCFNMQTLIVLQNFSF